MQRVHTLTVFVPWFEVNGNKCWSRLRIQALSRIQKREARRTIRKWAEKNFDTTIPKRELDALIKQGFYHVG